MGEFTTSNYAAATVQISVSIFDVEIYRQPVPNFHPTIFPSSRCDRLNFQILSKDVAGTCFFVSFGLDNSFSLWDK
jgi:hypothetical protein